MGKGGFRADAAHCSAPPRIGSTVAVAMAGYLAGKEPVLAQLLLIRHSYQLFVEEMFTEFRRNGGRFKIVAGSQ